MGLFLNPSSILRIFLFIPSAFFFLPRVLAIKAAWNPNWDFFLTLWQSFYKYCRKGSIFKTVYEVSVDMLQKRSCVSIHSYLFCGQLWPS